MDYVELLDDISKEDVAALQEARVHYGDSWKRRGGVGAFMMLARKWDRLERYLTHLPDPAMTYDIFAGLQRDNRTEGVIDDIRDLRRYLMLVEAEARANGITCAQPKE